MTSMQDCITNCLDCHSVCLATLSHCLEKGGVHAEASHIRLMQDCAQICITVPISCCGLPRCIR